jgi:hypothetical protein
VFNPATPLDVLKHVGLDKVDMVLLMSANLVARNLYPTRWNSCAKPALIDASGRDLPEIDGG